MKEGSPEVLGVMLWRNVARKERSPVIMVIHMCNQEVSALHALVAPESLVSGKLPSADCDYRSLTPTRESWVQCGLQALVSAQVPWLAEAVSTLEIVETYSGT